MDGWSALQGLEHVAPGSLALPCLEVTWLHYRVIRRQSTSCGPSSPSERCAQGALTYTDRPLLVVAAAATSVHIFLVALGLQRPSEVALCY